MKPQNMDKIGGGGAFGTRDAEGNYTLLGLREMVTTTSHDTLDTFKDILKDIDEVSELNTAHKILMTGRPQKQSSITFLPHTESRYFLK